MDFYSSLSQVCMYTVYKVIIPPSPFSKIHIKGKGIRISLPPLDILPHKLEILNLFNFIIICTALVSAEYLDHDEASLPEGGALQGEGYH